MQFSPTARSPGRVHGTRIIPRASSSRSSFDARKGVASATGRRRASSRCASAPRRPRRLLIHEAGSDERDAPQPKLHDVRKVHRRRANSGIDGISKGFASCSEAAAARGADDSAGTPDGDARRAAARRSRRGRSIPRRRRRARASRAPPPRRRLSRAQVAGSTTRRGRRARGGGSVQPCRAQPRFSAIRRLTRTQGRKVWPAAAQQQRATRPLPPHCSVLVPQPARALQPSSRDQVGEIASAPPKSSTPSDWSEGHAASISSSSSSAGLSASTGSAVLAHRGTSPARPRKRTPGDRHVDFSNSTGGYLPVSRDHRDIRGLRRASESTKVTSVLSEVIRSCRVEYR